MLTKLRTTIHTVRRLRLRQLFYQVLVRTHKPKLDQIGDAVHGRELLWTNTIPKAKCYQEERFYFLNIAAKFSSWNDNTHGMLWTYNQNYMDWLLQPGFTTDEGIEWINRFIQELPNNSAGLDAYPIALRGINWIKFISLNTEKITTETKKIWYASLYAQYELLMRKLEYHLLGNHLLEDAYSLFIASLFFENAGMFKKASRLLYRELNEQILPDGAHYEQSPMYHCILLDRLLDCYNFSTRNHRFNEQEKLNDFLLRKAQVMLGHLKSLIYQDHSIPLLNDSAYGIAPIPDDLFAYADRLDIDWQEIPMKECGYRKLEKKQFEAIVDVGNITASYQPGHSHADTFNYELRINGNPFVVDTGISTYNKTPRRQYERGTSAHNTVTIGGKNSSDVWGGFRVGKRAKVTLLKDDPYEIIAWHDGFGSLGKHCRKFILEGDGFKVEDSVSTNKEAISWLHLSPESEILSYSNELVVTTMGTIEITGASKVEIVDGEVSVEYNRFLAVKIVKIHFSNKLSYLIVYKNI